MLTIYWFLFGKICFPPRTLGLGVFLVFPLHSVTVRILAVFSMLTVEVGFRTGSSVHPAC